MTLAERLREKFPLIEAGLETTAQRKLIHEAAKRLEELENSQVDWSGITRAFS